MSDMCNDNRFELVAKYKAKLIESTNIETSADEMAVIDNILFRMWQMGWLDRLEQPTVDAVPVRHGEWIYTTLKRYKEYTATCPFCGAKYHDCYDGYIDVDDFNYCPNCGAKMDGADGERR